jgi:predicted transcriptional regulator
MKISKNGSISRFTAIKNDLLESEVWKELSNSAKVVFMRLRYYSDFDDKQVFPSLQTIAEQEGITKKTAHKGIKELMQKGVIIIKKDSKHNRYEFVYHNKIGVKITPIENKGVKITPKKAAYGVNITPTGVNFTPKSGYNLPSNHMVQPYLNNNKGNNMEIELSKKELNKKRKEFVEQLEKWSVILNTGSLEKINKLSYFLILSLTEQYKIDFYKGKVTNISGYWNKALCNEYHNYKEGMSRVWGLVTYTFQKRNGAKHSLY